MFLPYLSQIKHFQFFYNVIVGKYTENKLISKLTLILLYKLSCPKENAIENTLLNIQCLPGQKSDLPPASFHPGMDRVDREEVL